MAGFPEYNLSVIFFTARSYDDPGQHAEHMHTHQSHHPLHVFHGASAKHHFTPIMSRTSTAPATLQPHRRPLLRMNACTTADLDPVPPLPAASAGPAPTQAPAACSPVISASAAAAASMTNRDNGGIDLAGTLPDPCPRIGCAVPLSMRQNARTDRSDHAVCRRYEAGLCAWVGLRIRFKGKACWFFLRRAI